MAQKEIKCLPWNIVIHYRGIPEENIEKFTGMDSIRMNYMNSLKESMFLRNGTANDIFKIPNEETTKLLESVINHDYKIFWSINSKLIDATTKQDIKKTSIRIFSNKFIHFIQHPSSVLDEKGLDKTLKDYVFEVFTEMFEKTIEEGNEKIMLKEDLKNVKVLLISSL